MPNHFHWLLETPEPNLVDGMKWFLGAYSQRFNARHGQRGHVFQGRYKALLIEPDSGSYFETVSAYIHLNPARVRLLDAGNPELRKYAGSSYPFYLKTGKSRPGYLEVNRALGNIGLKDSKQGRKAYAEYMQQRVKDLRTKAGRNMYKKEWKRLRHDWRLGSEEFREKMLGYIGQKLEEYDRTNYSGTEKLEHDETRAERIVTAGLAKLGLKESDLSEMSKGDIRKRALSYVARKHTMVSNGWLSRRLLMGSASNMSSYIRSVEESNDADTRNILQQIGENNK